VLVMGLFVGFGVFVAEQGVLGMSDP